MIRLMDLMPAARRGVQSMLEFCYPGRCANCEGECDATAALCKACDALQEELEQTPSCETCAMPLASHGAPCPYCQGAGVAHYDRIVCLGRFRDPLKHLIHQIKYHGQWGLAEVLADRAMAQERVKAILSEAEVLLPVPLHPLRQIARGFNQADVVARRLKRLDRKLQVVHPVVRVRNTETQTHLHSQAQRAENLRDAFGLINPEAILGKHVVVIDDVRTTGATLQAVARALQPARPATLCALVLAVADPKGQDFEAI